jgi:antitoxin Phd
VEADAISVQGYWQVQEAKSKLSALLTEAQRAGPQSITRHGKTVAVVLSVADYERLAVRSKASLLELLSAPALRDLHIEKRDRDDVGREVEL